MAGIDVGHSPQAGTHALKFLDGLPGFVVEGNPIPPIFPVKGIPHPANLPVG
jgi:hypothetical protein